MDNISFDDFVKVEMYSGSVLSIEAVPKSKKLVKLEVSFGQNIGNRTIMAGLAKSAADGLLIVGQKVVAVLNLVPREMMGVQSNGMLLACHGEDDKVWLLNPGPVPDGTKVG